MGGCSARPTRSGSQEHIDMRPFSWRSGSTLQRVSHLGEEQLGRRWRECRELRPGKASQPRAAGLVPAALALGVETSPGPLGSLESSEGEGDPRAEPVTPHRPSGPACLSCPHKNGD